MEYLHVLVFRCDKCQSPILTAVICANSPCSHLELYEKVVPLQCLACQHKQNKYGAEAVRRFDPMDWPYRIGLEHHKEDKS
jgi:hypothetical protein